MNRLYQISLSYACFGIEISPADKCVRVAPIARWMMGKDFIEIIEWIEKKNGTINYIEL